MKRYGTIPAFEGKIEGKRVIFECEGELIYLEPYGENTIRFRSSASLKIDTGLDWTLLTAQVPEEASSYLADDRAVIENGSIRAEILGDGTVTYFDRNGRVLLTELWLDKRMGTAPQRKAREYRHLAGDSFRTEIYFAADETEHFYGLGQEANDCLDLKGCTVDLIQKNTKCTIPFVMSSKGYGFIWNNPSVGTADLTCNHTRWKSEASKQVDYLVIGGEKPADIMRDYTRLTGRADVLPEWAAGFWQSRLRYETQEETLRIASEYKRRGIPLSVLVIDYFHWPLQGEWKFDERYWPEVPQMCRQLEEMGVHPMVSVWPTVDPRSENYNLMKKKNYLVRAEQGVNTFFMIMGPEGIMDVTGADARSFVWDRIRENYYNKGIKAFWLDEAEPEMRPYSFENVRYNAGNGLEVTNVYPFCYAQTFYEGMKGQGEKEIVNLCRCAWLGSQRLNIVLWSGDIPSDYDSLRCQVKAGLNAAVSGIPWWTTDIGGFYGGDPKDPEFVELLIRWFEYGAFCPIFRLHGKRLPYDNVNKQTEYDAFLPSCAENEIWSFGDEAYEIMKKYILLREKLKPYIMKQMEQAHENGSPVMRPLFYDFHMDPAAYGIDDEFMFGPDLLVAPVTQAHKTEREVYFPEGTDWYSAWSGEHFEGGSFETVEAPIDRIPVFCRSTGNIRF